MYISIAFGASCGKIFLQIGYSVVTDLLLQRIGAVCHFLTSKWETLARAASETELRASQWLTIWLARFDVVRKKV